MSLEASTNEPFLTAEPCAVPQTPEGEHAPALTPKEIKRNMVFCIMLDAIYATGWTDFLLALSPLLVFLNASNVLIGLVSGASVAGLFGMFVTPWISRRFRIKKWYLIVTNIPYLAAIGLAGLGIVNCERLGFSQQELLLFVTVMVLLHNFFAGFVALPHQEYVAATIPMTHRGRFNGFSTSAGALMSIGSAAIGGWILLHYAKPAAFGYLFLMTWLICQGGYVLAAFAKEIPTPVEKSPKPWSRDMVKAAWHDKQYLRFLALFMLTILLVWPVFGFVSIYGYKVLGMIPATAAILQIITQAVRICTCVIAGWITDKYSPKKVLPYWTLFTVPAFLAPVLIQNQYGVYLSSALSTIYFAGIVAGFTTLMFGLPKPEHRAGHYTIQLIVQYAVATAGPIIAGIVLDHVPYRTVFIAAAVIALGFYPLTKFLLRGISDDAKQYS